MGAVALTGGVAAYGKGGPPPYALVCRRAPMTCGCRGCFFQAGVGGGSSGDGAVFEFVRQPSLLQ